MKVGTLPDGSRGVDANTTISRDSAAMLVLYGYRFAIRYVRRAASHPYDLTSGEALGIIGAALGLMVVQHVAPEGWTPTPAAGTLYGNTAVIALGECGVPADVTTWLDLEGVKHGTPHADVIAFCNNWFDVVDAIGYEPGLYVGDSCGLTPAELHGALKFEHYWSAYNLNADQFPAVRGVQMRQSAAKAGDLVPGFTNQNMDVDVIRADAMGGTPSLWLP